MTRWLALATVFLALWHSSGGHHPTPMTSQDTDRTAQGALPGKPDPQPGQAGWRVTAASAARQHWPALVLLAGGLVLRILALLAYRPALFYIDTPRYLLGEAPGMDPLGYGGVLRRSPGGFDLVVAILVGRSVAVWHLCSAARGRGAGSALAIAPVLLDAYQGQSSRLS
jgi:hypothetical protein